jgi:hypothetical protein
MDANVSSIDLVTIKSTGHAVAADLEKINVGLYATQRERVPFLHLGQLSMPTDPSSYNLQADNN